MRDLIAGKVTVYVDQTHSSTKVLIELMEPSGPDRPQHLRLPYIFWGVVQAM